MVSPIDPTDGVPSRIWRPWGKGGTSLHSDRQLGKTFTVLETLYRVENENQVKKNWISNGSVTLNCQKVLNAHSTIEPSSFYDTCDVILRLLLHSLPLPLL